MRVIISMISYTVRTRIEIMSIASAIIAVMIMSTIVSTAIAVIVVRFAKASKPRQEVDVLTSYPDWFNF